MNLGTEPFAVTRGMRIAQLVFARVERIEFQAVAELPRHRAGHGRVRQHRTLSSGVRSLECGRRQHFLSL